MRQVLSALYLGYLIKWRRLPHWLFKAPKTIPLAAGSIGMGCIGFPIHPVWEVTAACNLRCHHCHARGGKPLTEELNTPEGKKLIDDIAAIDEFRMLVFSGGEPMVRRDIFELVEHASSLGLEVIIATNGTLITNDVAKRLKKAGVCDLAIGLDGATAEVHDFIRGVPGCFERTMRGINATKEAGIALQINITVMKYNYHQIPELLDLTDKLDAEVVLLYNLVPQGRGQEEDIEITLEQYARLMEFIAERQKRAKPIIEPTCSPQYWAYLINRNGTGRLGSKLSQMAFKGCVAGSGLCYIKPDGEVWTCPFIPISGGNVRELPLSYIWYESDVFKSLKDRGNLKGKCSQSRYKNICGGCRGRAYAHFGDYLAQDPLCFIPYSATEGKH
jgi:radical SAM protein with 4Fe4S-binding SPASM domain